MKPVSLRNLALAASTSCGLGLFVAAPASASTTLNPVADTYVASGAASTVQGNATSMIANQSTNTNHRWAYVRFDLSAINPATITNLELDLHNTAAGGATTTVDVYGLVNAENFGEGSLTFNNDPNATGNTFNRASAFNQTPLATFTSKGTAAGKDVAFSVSSGSVFDFLNADADKVVTFVLDQETLTGANSGQAWSTKEDTTAANRPALAVTTAATPEPGTLGVVTAGLGGLLARRRRRA